MAEQRNADPRNGHESFLTVREMVTEIRQELKELRAEVAPRTVTDDHERRIRATERWMYGIPLSGVLALGGVIAAFIR